MNYWRKKKWDLLFAETEDELSRHADEALSEYEQGKTQIMNFDEL